MRNKYPGVCYRCGGFVAPREGHFEKVSAHQFKKWPRLAHRGKWLLQHAECAIKYRGTDVHHIYNPEGGSVSHA